MENDYISREAVERFIEKGLNNPDKKKAFGHDAVEILTEVHFMYAADVRPVVKARWKPRDLTYGRQYYYCTSCEDTVDMPTAMGIPLFNYCPNCGADMRGEKNEGRFD